MGAAEPPGLGQPDRLSEELARTRELGFVGRAAELRSFRDALAGTSASRILFVHGPGGIGKTTLLDAFSRHARGAGREPVYVDARDLECTAAAIGSAVAEQARRCGYPAGREPDVLLIDGYELLVPLDRWVREDLLAARPTTSVTVLAGREPPPASWRLDPGWRRLAQVHPLAGLDAADSDELLARFGLPRDRRTVLAGVGRGHPLVLAMLAEADRGGSAPAALTEAPDVVAQLCRLIIDDIPDAAHRAGLATCAHATRMTADLLARTVGSRAEEVWAWLGSRPYVRRGVLGLHVHDVVREIFEAEFMHRSPDAYVALHIAVRGYFLDRLADPAEPRPDRAAAEILFLHRAGPLSDRVAGLREGGILPVATAGPEDRAGILALIEEGEGAASAELARRWIAEQPGCLYRARSDTGVEGFSMQVYLPTGAALDVDDPVAVGVLAAAAERGPLRPGERINVNRFAGASGSYQQEPMLLLVNGVSCLLEWARRPAAWTFIVTVEPETYGPYFGYLGMSEMWRGPAGPPARGGGAPREAVAYGWDRRRFPAESLFEMMARRELTGEQGPPPADLVRPAPLSHTAFATEVRAALHQLARPDRLAGSALLGSALVDVTATDPAGGLARTLTGAIASLSNERNGGEHRRVLERTYVRAAPSQEAAAELLGLPFSTYRRHLARAQERLVEVLWAIEIGERGLPGAEPDRN
ncbi:ATP-binding protein [Occultella kanbiaonis]|uniref:ATP-binding protein n=1 Tax=Occultella kanbiaonis TaxID=2675754 RepID=UPI0012B71689|nr:ATP-binding protein [Occultella kanbiaonis]